MSASWVVKSGNSLAGSNPRLKMAVVAFDWCSALTESTTTILPKCKYDMFRLGVMYCACGIACSTVKSSHWNTATMGMILI